MSDPALGDNLWSSSTSIAPCVGENLASAKHQPHHLWLFPPHSLTAQCARSGFAIPTTGGWACCARHLVSARGSHLGQYGGTG